MDSIRERVKEFYTEMIFQKVSARFLSHPFVGIISRNRRSSHFITPRLNVLYIWEEVFEIILDANKISKIVSQHHFLQVSSCQMISNLMGGGALPFLILCLTLYCMGDRGHPVII